MQEFDIQEDNSETQGVSKAEQLKQYLQFAVKRLIVFVCFGPGVLGVLWLIGRILRR